MKCWFCDSELIWGGDFNPEDYGYEGNGVVSNLSCASCGATFECTYLEENDGRLNKQS